MRKKQPENRIYNFPDADLYMQCIERLNYAKRDHKLFEEYGYNRQKMEAFYARCEQFKELPNDDEVVGDQMIVTQKKYAAAEKLRGAIRSLMTRVAVQYHNKSGRYRKFGTAKLGDMTDAQLLFCGRRTARVARQQLDFLADVGINEKVISKVVDAYQAFENAMHIQQDRVSERDLGVERRTEIGNKIYNELVVLCNIGKDIWNESDATKYQNYCIYESNNEQKKQKKAQKEEDDLDSLGSYRG